jgi:hypothetical protein
VGNWEYFTFHFPATLNPRTVHKTTVFIGTILADTIGSEFELDFGTKLSIGDPSIAVENGPSINLL